MALLNDFKLGADPEFVIQEGAHIKQYKMTVRDAYVPWGIDHGGWVIEPHPKPEFSVRALTINLKKSFNDFATVAPTGKWKAGAYLQATERVVTLGGHVHIDKPKVTPEQLKGLDLVAKHLEALDILPATECEERRNAGAGYGKYGDVRVEHGHFEYRTLPSWLYSQRVTKICLTASKLVVVDPAAPEEVLGIRPTYASIEKLKAFFERFKNKDDDVDWILDSGMLDKRLAVKPDRDLRDVWAVKPEKETPHWKEEEAKRNPQKQALAPWERAERNDNDDLPVQVRPFCYDAGLRGIFVTNGPGTGLMRKIGMRGEPWDLYGDNHTKIVRCTVLGTMYKFRVLEGTVVNASLFKRLRNIVLQGINQAGMQEVDGLAFQYEGRVGE